MISAYRELLINILGNIIITYPVTELMKTFDETFIPAFLSNNIMVFRTFCGTIILRSFDISIFLGDQENHQWTTMTPQSLLL